MNIQRLKIQKPFTYRHAETTFEKYTLVDTLGTALIHDPDNFIKWENGADIQVTYAVPDDTWANYTDLRKYGAFFDVLLFKCIASAYTLLLASQYDIYNKRCPHRA